MPEHVDRVQVRYLKTEKELTILRPCENRLEGPLGISLARYWRLGRVMRSGVGRLDGGAVAGRTVVTVMSGHSCG